jgi:site-specific recombinase XerD
VVTCYHQPTSPHQLRHAFADRVTRQAGLRASQALLGHASIQTTEGYLTKPSPDELVAAMAQVTLGAPGQPFGHPLVDRPQGPGLP